LRHDLKCAWCLDSRIIACEQAFNVRWGSNFASWYIGERAPLRMAGVLFEILSKVFLMVVVVCFTSCLSVYTWPGRLETCCGGWIFFCGSQKNAWQRSLKIKDTGRIWEGNNDQNLDRIIDISLLPVFLGLGARHRNCEHISHGGWYYFDLILRRSYRILNKYK
jgi:hypothetical protein